jgi:CubicO group peptidase (beta-lactamase class C family)
MNAGMTRSSFLRQLLLLTLAATGSSSRTSVAADDSSPGGRLAAALQPFVDNHLLAGAVVMVASKDKVLDVEALGFADVAARRPMRTDCMFWIASQSKPITAAALMMLVDEGKVKLDDPVEKYLSEFAGQMVVAERDKEHVLLRKPRHPITVRNVLSHTSGLPFSTPIEKPTLDLFPLACRVRSYAMSPLDFEPGSKNQYSNAGLNSAGRIVEVVSGMSFERFLDERLFKPLGMKDTTFRPTSEQLQRLARAYRPGKGGLVECRIDQLHYPLDDPQREPMPAGGLFSTADDLSRFYRMFANNGSFNGKQILSPAAVREMTTRQPAYRDYGLGTRIRGDRIGHSGAYNSDSSFNPKNGLIEIFLVQHATWAKGGEKILGVFHKAADEFAEER